ncbi:MAG: hypothetical protein LCI00_09765 [Chloroflexi bacterium]|nr:hypothetical protein [Chloroflexota bacterium]MCC6892987.1 PD40 domain-containing protein [Anaerolineae bacterium]
MKRLLITVLVLLCLSTRVLAGETAVPKGEIAFASDREGTYKVFLMSADGSDVRLLVEDENPIYTPLWSPDGTKLAYMVAEGDGKAPLYVWDLDEPEAVRIADSALNPYRFLTWSLNSRMIAYANFTDGDSANGVEYHSAATDGSLDITIGVGEDDLALIQYLPDRSLTVSRSSGLFGLDADGTNELFVTDDLAYPAVLSPSFEYLVGYSYESDNLEITDPNGRNPNVVFNRDEHHLSYIIMLGWSPDEQYIWGVGRFAESAEVGAPAEDRLFIVKQDGTGFHFVNAGDTVLTWSPDSQFIAYTRQDEAGGYQIFTARPDGSDEQQITTDGNNAQPTWRANYA